ncbi:MAG: hypothetical protein Q8P67_26135 [archaeon]|nr:hypothetical protein [archaeon]
MITLQLGHYSNHVGAHYWNQLSLEQNPPVLGHVAASSSGYAPAALSDLCFSNPLWAATELPSSGRVSFHPRLLIFDAKGSLGSLSASTARHVDRVELDAIVKHTLALGTIPSLESLELYDNALPQSSFRATTFDQGVGSSSSSSSSSSSPSSISSPEPGSWTDFFEGPLKPGNLYELPNVHHEIDGFLAFPEGACVMERLEDRDAVLDSLRRQIELCDALLGFQSLVDIDTAFAGFASDLFQEIRNEHGSRPLLAYGLSRPLSSSASLTRQQLALRSLNPAFAMGHLADHATAYFPLSTPQQPPLGISRAFPGLQTSQSYHSSLIPASALDLITLPFRPIPCASLPPRHDDIRFYARDISRRSQVLAVSASWLCSPTPLSRSAIEQDHSALFDPRSSLWGSWQVDDTARPYSQTDIYRTEPLLQPAVATQTTGEHSFPVASLARTFPRSLLAEQTPKPLVMATARIRADRQVGAAIGSMVAEAQRVDPRVYLTLQTNALAQGDLEEMWNTLSTMARFDQDDP